MKRRKAFQKMKRKVMRWQNRSSDSNNERGNKTADKKN
jgi:hypothetical protein